MCKITKEETQKKNGFTTIFFVMGRDKVTAHAMGCRDDVKILQERRPALLSWLTHSKAQGFGGGYPKSSRLAAGVHPTELKYLIRNPIALNFPTVNEERARAMPAGHLQKRSQNLGGLNCPLDFPQFTCCYHVNPGLKSLRWLLQDS